MFIKALFPLVYPRERGLFFLVLRENIENRSPSVANLQENMGNKEVFPGRLCKHVAKKLTQVADMHPSIDEVV